MFFGALSSFVNVGLDPIETCERKDQGRLSTCDAKAA